VRIIFRLKDACGVAAGEGLSWEPAVRGPGRGQRRGGGLRGDAAVETRVNIDTLPFL